MTNDIDYSIILPAPIEEILNEQDKWDYITAAVERAVQFNISQYQTRITLREAGLRFSNTVMSAIYSRTKYGFQQFSYPTNLPQSLIPDLDIVSEAPYSMDFKYGYVGSFQYIDSEGKIIHDSFRYETDKLLSKSAIEEQFDSMLDYLTGQYGKLVTGITYEGMVKNRGF